MAGVHERVTSLPGDMEARRDQFSNRVRVAVNQVSNDWQQVRNCVSFPALFCFFEKGRR